MRVGQAFIFPGQGSQKVGMGYDLFHKTEIGKKRYRQANEIMELDIAKLSFEGPEEILKQTQFTQPAIFIVSVILAELLLEEGTIPSCTAGHSLGEYSALMTAGVFSFEEGLNLVTIRGKTMQEAGRNHPGTMAAILGLDSDQIIRICEECQEDGIVQPANFNSHSQIVISGEVNAVRKAMKLAQERGALKCVELSVSGAFHSSLMNSAKTNMQEALNKIPFQTPHFPGYMNVSANLTTDPKTIEQNLINQIDHPVRWVETIENMKSTGVTQFIEIGPGKVLRRLNKRIDPNLVTKSIESLEDIRETVHA